VFNISLLPKVNIPAINKIYYIHGMLEMIDDLLDFKVLFFSVHI